MEVSHVNISRMLGFVSVGFGAIALLLACVGIGTPNWQVIYYTAPNLGQIQSTNNFFYACNFFTNGSLNECVNRNDSLIYYSNNNFFGGLGTMNDTNSRLQNAAGLSIVGLLFIAFGTVATLLMVIVTFPVWINLVAPALLFLACLFMLAGLSEGARVLLYNGYAANLYETAHLLTILSCVLSALAAGRIHFERMNPGKL